MFAPNILCLHITCKTKYRAAQVSKAIKSRPPLAGL